MFKWDKQYYIIIHYTLQYYNQPTHLAILKIKGETIQNKHRSCLYIFINKWLLFYLQMWW